MEEEKQDNTQVEKVAGLLEKCGLASGWAKVLAGAILGALAAVGLGSLLTGCAGGLDLTVETDKGNVSWTMDENQKSTIVIKKAVCK